MPHTLTVAMTFRLDFTLQNKIPHKLTIRALYTKTTVATSHVKYRSLQSCTCMHVDPSVQLLLDGSLNRSLSGQRPTTHLFCELSPRLRHKPPLDLLLQCSLPSDISSFDAVHFLFPLFLQRWLIVFLFFSMNNRDRTTRHHNHSGHTLILSLPSKSNKN